MAVAEKVDWAAYRAQGGADTLPCDRDDAAADEAWQRVAKVRIKYAQPQGFGDKVTP